MTDTFDPQAYLSKKQASTPFDPEAYLANKGPGLVEQWSQAGLDTMRSAGTGLGKLASTAGTAGDYIGGAPTRAAIGAGLEGKNPATAFFGQYAKRPADAPTGKELAAKAGLSTEETLPAPLIFNPFDKAQQKVSPAGVVGFGVDVLADPTNLIPVGTIAKAGTTTTMKAVGTGAKAAAKATDLVLGTDKTMKALEAVKGTGTALKQGVAAAGKKFFFPRVAEDFGEYAAIAEKHGISPAELPPSVEFGPNSAITYAWRSNYEGKLGEEARRKFGEVQGKVRAATDRVIEKIAGGTPPPTKLEAGAALRESYNANVAREMAMQDDSYRAIADAMPNVAVTGQAYETLSKKLDRYANEAKQMLTFHKGSPELRSEAQHILGMIEGVEASTKSLPEMRLALISIGREAFKARAPGMIPVDVAMMRQLYNDSREAFVDAVRQADPARAQALVEHNKRVSALFEDRKLLEKIVDNPAKDDAQVFDAIFSGGTNHVKALERIVDAETFNKLTATFVDDLRRETKSGEWTFGRLHQQLQNKRNVLSSILNREDMQAIDDLTRLGNRMGEPRLSTSGTGASIAQQNWWSDAKAEVANLGFVQGMADRARNAAAKEGILIPGSQIQAEQVLMPRRTLLPDVPIFSKQGFRKQAAQAASTAETNEQRKKYGKPLLPRN